jgi:hypothetical protein
VSTWEQLDSYLGGLTHQLGGMAYIFGDGGLLQLSPEGPHDPALVARFEQACRTVKEVFGPDCLKTGHWKRHIDDAAANRFVAEPVLSAYHLIVLFEDQLTSTEWMVHALDHARPILAGIISGLPPLDGGRRAGSAAEPIP